jgi:ATP-dependent RNA helicase RhlB
VPQAEGKTRFHDLDLPQELMHAIADLKFQYATPIQAESLPHTLKGCDIFGKAQTGTGKTAAFLITAMTKLLRNPRTEEPRRGTPRVLILAPTRELCLQIHKDAMALGKYCGFNTVAVFGGMDYDKQRAQLSEQRVDIVAATPGRLLDFKQRQDIHLSRVEILVIDEADRMLDMGFIPDVREIVYSTPPKGKRQTMFYSATLTPEIQRLSASWTHEPVSIEIAPENVAVDTVDQKVFIVTTQEKFALLMHFLRQPEATRVIVFANRRIESERLQDALRRFNIECGMLTGDVPQEKRIRVLEGFRNGKFKVLVATDVAGRGIHVDGVSHVINFNMPNDPEDYVHRIGRTGRAGASGQSISFACEEDSFAIPDVEKYLGRPLKFSHPEDEWLKLPEPPAGQASPAGMPPRRPSSGRPPFRGGGRGGPRGGPRRGPPRK